MKVSRHKRNEFASQVSAGLPLLAATALALVAEMQSGWTAGVAVFLIVANAGGNKQSRTKFKL